MYNDTIKAENKIITNEDLFEIFQLMGETLKKYQKISKVEEQRNAMLDYSYQEYSFKDEGSKMKVIVDFYDNTNITFDNYDNFASIFYSRIEEIKSMSIYYSLYYNVVTPVPNRTRTYYSQSITMYINENKMDIELKLSSEDQKLYEIYELIKNKILNAKEKYDVVIRKKSSITNTVALSSGIIPGLILSVILLFVPSLNTIFFKGFVVFPICSLLVAFVIGTMIASGKLDKYYETIMPEKKYAGYSNGKSVYKDDLEKFLGTSEILIGNKVNNLKNREQIMEEYNSAKNFLPIGLMLLLVASLLVILIGLFI